MSWLRFWFSWIWRTVLWLFRPMHVLIEDASEYGTITFQQTQFEDSYGWHCSIRAHSKSPGPRYAWTATAASMEDALLTALREARENPIKPIIGTPCAPKLGGAEFDDE